MIITREKGMRMWGGGSGSTSASGVNGGGGFSLAVTEGEGTGNAYTGFTYESGVLSLIKGEKFVTVDFFNRLFTAYDANGNAIVPNDTTTAINNLKIMVGAWTEQYLSALGLNSQGGGGGTGTVTAIKVATNTYLDPDEDGIIDMSSYAATWNNKQNTITDLATIRSNASHGNTAYGYFTSGIANNAARLSNTTKIGDTNQPVYFSASGVPVAISYTIGKSVPTNAVFTDTTYKLTLNGTTNGASGGTSLGSFYAPTAVGTDGYVLKSSGSGAPSWVAQSTLSVGTAAKLGTGTTTYTAWGQTYWSSGVPQSISGNMTSVGSITPSANGNALGTTSARFNIYGTAGNFSGNVSITGTLGVTGATTLSSTLSVAGGITLTTTKKIYFGDTSHYLELDSTGFHFSHGVYSDSFVSALGANSSGGGGGGIDIEAMWAELQGNTGTYANTKINVNHIPDISSTYGYAKTSQLGSYLPLSGGTLTNVLTIATGADKKLIIDNTDTETKDSLISFRQNGTEYGTLGTWGNDNLLWKGNIVINTNNIGSYALPLSGGTMSNTNLVTNLNADLLDGQHASYFATASSLSNYVTVTTAQTISGDKTFTGSIIMGTRSILGANETGGAMSYFDGSRTVIGSVGATSTKATHLRSITGHLTVGNSNTASYNVLDSGNYTDYTVTKTGTGASGTWGISISGTAAQANQVYDYQSGDGAFFASCQRGIGSTNTGALVLAYGSNPIRFYTDNTEKMRIAAAGNVGIGTDSPSYKLDVVGSIRASDSVYVGTGGAAGNSYVSSDSATNICLNNSSGAVLVCDSKVVRRGIALSDVTLGSSSYPWLAAYATTFHGALNGNASTATTLATPRTIWGQSFDGSSDVSGSITGATTITASGRISASAFEGDFVTDGTVFYFGDSQHAIGSGTDAVLWAYGANSLLFYTNNLKRMTIDSGGSVGIGTSSPSQKLHVTGNILASGEVTASSDERLKTIVGDGNLDLRYIANAPNILFKWNNGQDDKVHGGSLAQYFLTGAKHFVLGSDKDYYSLNYGALATSMAISIAKEVVRHDDEITRLKKEVVKLRERVAELEERRVA